MSVYYEVYEHLILEETECHGYELDMTLSRLSLLGAWILNGHGQVGKLRVIADGTEHNFSGRMMTQDYHEALIAASKAKSVEIMWNYGYSHGVLDVDPGPLSMMKYLDDLLKEEPQALDGLFYSAYHNADCDTSVGKVVAYGKKDGILYAGELPYVKVDSIPNGDWYTPLTAVVCEPDDTEGMDLAAMDTLCRELGKFSEADSLIFLPETGEFSFFLNNLRIRNDAELKEFMQLYAKLIDLTEGVCGLIGELADISQPDVKILRFDVEANGTYTLEMATV